MKNQNNIVVSICCITYNHIQFIQQALDSFLMQITNFPMEIIVHDDCSTDGTIEIINAYHKKYPDLIRTIFQTENQWSKGRKIFPIVAEQTHGKYIALCEGDDYWTDQYKLQKQVDFLEQHSECSMCAHNTKFIDNIDPSIERYQWTSREKLILDLQDIFKGYSFHTSSVMMRNGLITEFPEWYYKFPTGDWPLYALVAQHGKVGIIDEVMSVYRRHSYGIWSPLSIIEKSLSVNRQYRIFRENFGKEFQNILFKSFANQFFYLGRQLFWTEIQNGLPVEKIIQEAQHFLEKLIEDGNYISTQKSLLRRKYNSFLYEAIGFHFYQQKNLRYAFRYLLKACKYDIARLGNRGFWSICFEAIFGKQIATFIRKLD